MAGGLHPLQIGIRKSLTKTVDGTPTPMELHLSSPNPKSIEAAYRMEAWVTMCHAKAMAEVEEA